MTSRAVSATAATARFSAYRAAHHRADTMDLKVAAVAHARDVVLLSGQVRDFAAVAGLRFELFRP